MKNLVNHNVVIQEGGPYHSPDFISFIPLERPEWWDEKAAFGPEYINAMCTEQLLGLLETINSVRQSQCMT